jgi:hypothetical protein
VDNEELYVLYSSAILLELSDEKRRDVRDLQDAWEDEKCAVLLRKPEGKRELGRLCFELEAVLKYI